MSEKEQEKKIIKKYIKFQDRVFSPHMIFHISKDFRYEKDVDRMIFTIDVNKVEGIDKDKMMNFSFSFYDMQERDEKYDELLEILIENEIFDLIDLDKN